MMQELTMSQTIQKIEQLIEKCQGDVGRLRFIVESIKNKKQLYHSDQKYLESKLQSNISLENEIQNKSPQTILDKIQQLINSGIGDSGRLQHIYDTVSNGKTLYRSDQIYLENKLDQNVISKTTDLDRDEKQYFDNIELKTEATRGSMPKEWGLQKSSEKNDVAIKILKEEAEIDNQIKLSNELEIQKSKLTQLILKRKEFEQKINHEKSILESQIRKERTNIEVQTRLSDQITAQKEELKKVKTTRNSVLKTIEKEKSRITKDLVLQKKLLAQAQLEQEKLKKELEDEQTRLTNMVEEQKSRLVEQAQMAQQIKLMQTELDDAKKQYDDITAEVTQEKIRLDKVEKLKKSIESKEKDLNKVQEQRLGLLNIIAKEKEKISKQTQKEKEKLKKQSELQRHLKKEEIALLKLKTQRKKLEEKLKQKRNKLRERQNKVKKDISKKSSELNQS